MFGVKFDEERKVWRTDDIPLVYNPSVSLGHILLRSMEQFGPRIAQISDDTGERFTFDELRLMTIRAAQNLHRRNYAASKQVIGIISRNVAHVAPIAFAALCLGCPINSMHTNWKVDTIRVLQMTEPALIFCEAKLYDLVCECLDAVGNRAKIFTFCGTKGGSEPVENLLAETGDEDDFRPVDIDGTSEVAAIMSTSGTSGPSKGICLTHSALASEFHTANIRMFANGIIFNPCPLYWISGLFTILVGTVSGTTRIITTENFSAEMQMRIINDYQVTILQNDSYDMLLMIKSGILSKDALRSVKHVLGGGCKIPFTVLEEFNSYLLNGHVHNEYGCTEVGGVAFDFPEFSGKEDSVGRLINGLIVKIIDENGNRCGINANGEICIKSRYNFRGYFRNDEFTKEAIDDEGFFRSGDIGRIDNEGYLYIADRKKNVIHHPNEWIFPSEIEKVLLKLAGIQSACVVGVPIDEAAEFPAAFIVHRKGAEITVEQINKIVEDTLDDHCKLRGGIYFVDSMPMSATGKPLRRVLKDKAIQLYSMKMENMRQFQ